MDALGMGDAQPFGYLSRPDQVVHVDLPAHDEAPYALIGS